MSTNTISRLTMLCCTILLTVHLADATDRLLEGPVIAVTTDTGVMFVDLGTEDYWFKDLTFEGYAVSGWMPDGCHLLVSKVSEDYKSRVYSYLSINTLEFREISFNGRPIFSPNGTHIVYFNESDGLAKLDYVELRADFSLSSPITIAEYPYGEFRPDGVSWATDDTLIYETSSSRFVWNRVDRSVEEVSPLRFPIIPRFHSIARSPDGLKLAVFANLREYFTSIDPRLTELTETEIEEAKGERPSKSGLSLYDLTEGDGAIHIAVNNTFLFQVVWSPDSNRLALVADPSSAETLLYVYEQPSASLELVGGTYFGDSVYSQPSWSVDSQWLSYKIRGGLVVEEIDTRQEIIVPMNTEAISFLWSPRMSYSDYECPQGAI